METWVKAETIYRSLDEVQPLLRSQINQAQALRSLGFYRRAKNTLEQANQELIDLPDSLLKVKALQSLGVTLRAMGDLSESGTVLNQSLNIARQLNAPIDIELIRLSLANTAKAKQDYQTAQTIYKQLRIDTSDLKIKIDVSLNLLDLLIVTEQNDVAEELFPAIASDIDISSPSLHKIYAQVNLVDSMLQIPESKSYSSEIKNILTAAREQAEEINNKRAKSYVLGELGRFYELEQQWNRASKLTQQAILLAQNSQATGHRY